MTEQVLMFLVGHVTGLRPRSAKSYTVLANQRHTSDGLIEFGQTFGDVLRGGRFVPGATLKGGFVKSFEFF